MSNEVNISQSSSMYTIESVPITNADSVTQWIYEIFNSFDFQERQWTGVVRENRPDSKFREELKNNFSEFIESYFHYLISDVPKILENNKTQEQFFSNFPDIAIEVLEHDIDAKSGLLFFALSENDMFTEVFEKSEIWNIPIGEFNQAIVEILNQSIGEKIHNPEIHEMYRDKEISRAELLAYYKDKRVEHIKRNKDGGLISASLGLDSLCIPNDHLININRTCAAEHWMIEAFVKRLALFYALVRSCYVE